MVVGGRCWMVVGGGGWWWVVDAGGLWVVVGCRCWMVVGGGGLWMLDGWSVVTRRVPLLLGQIPAERSDGRMTLSRRELIRASNVVKS